MADYALSKTAQTIQRSVMRDLIALAVSPEIISLAGGLPANAYLPVEALQACFETVLRRDGYRALQYGPPYPPLREWLAGYMQERGVTCAPEQVFITNGAQQGLAVLSRLFADPGDTAVVEQITFTGVQQVTAGRRLRVRAVPTQLDTGVDVEALAAAFRAQPRPKFCVLIPNFHNPLGVSISQEKRKRIAELANSCRVPIVEDDPYAPLRFAGDPLPALKAFDAGDRVFYIGSFSKMLAPGVRLGWIIAPKELGSRITVLRESLDLESSQLIQRAVAEFLLSGRLASHLDRLNRVNRERCEALLSALAAELGPLGAQWTRPEGGLFAWVTLPSSLDAGKMFDAAIAQKVAYIPGAAFAVTGGCQNTLRLNFSNASAENIREAITRLAAVVRNFL